MTQQRNYGSMLILVALIFLFSAIPTAAATRTALVIGNSDYRSTSLANPVNDAADIATTLKKLGFDVIVKTNANKLEMLKALEVFMQKLRRSDAGLFYFAGHGMQIRGSNYLIPVDVQINRELEVEYESVNAGRVLATMEGSGCKVNIIILDACRNNPFRRKFRSVERGLAIMDAPSGSIIAYSTAPGSVALDGEGRNGLYTSQLLKYIQIEGLSIEECFRNIRVEVMKGSNKKQVPWESSSLTNKFYFVPKKDKHFAKNNTSSNQSFEYLYWESIKDSKDAVQFRSYIDSFPNGTFVDLATILISKYGKNKVNDVEDIKKKEVTLIDDYSELKTAESRDDKKIYEYDRNKNLIKWNDIHRPLELKSEHVNIGISTPLHIKFHVDPNILNNRKVLPLRIRIDCFEAATAYLQIRKNGKTKYHSYIMDGLNDGNIEIPVNALSYDENFIKFSAIHSGYRYQLVELQFKLFGKK